MTLGERIKACRQQAKLSQEKVAELVGVSRQAVTKWEADQSAPSTENLFKLAEVFGTTVDLLLNSEGGQAAPLAEQIYALQKQDEEQRTADRRHRRKRNALLALFIVLGYLTVYLIGRAIWCDLSQCSILGWLITERPSGAHSYLYGWLLSSGLFWAAMAISAVPALFGKDKFALTTLAAFGSGLLLGMLFGPNPEGAPYGQGHYGWAIWGIIYLLSMVVGAILERFAPKNKK